MSRYWISWYEPTPDDDYRPITVPEKDSGVVAWWCSGHVGLGESATLVAVIDAADEDAAKALIEKHWLPEDWRFVEPQEPEWMPDPGRFPFTEAENAEADRWLASLRS